MPALKKKPHIISNMDPLDNLQKTCFEIARDLPTSNTLFTYNDFELTYNNYGNLSKISITKEFISGNIYNDGSVLCGFDTFKVPLVLVYMSVHILQNYHKESMCKRHNINSVLPDEIDRDLFWIGEYQISDLHNIWIDLCEVRDPIDPGVFVSLNTYGSTISFMEARSMISDDIVSKDYKMPICVIKTPDGISTSNSFQYEEFDVCTNFIDALEHTMMMVHKQKQNRNYMNVRQNNKMIHLRNGVFEASAYVLFTTMNDMVFDHTNGTYKVIWNVMSAYTD